MKQLKNPLAVITAALMFALVACGTKPEKWSSLMPDTGTTNWRTVGAEPDPQTSPDEIVLSGDKVMVYAPGGETPSEGTETAGVEATAGMPVFRNFVLSARVLTEPEAASSLWFHHGERAFGYEIALGNKRLDGGRLKRGSLVNVRNVYESAAADGRWWDLEVAVRGKNITVKIDGALLVDYVEPDKPYRPMEDMARLGAGTFALDSYEGVTRLSGMKVRELPDNAVGRTDAVGENADNFMQLVDSPLPDKK